MFRHVQYKNKIIRKFITVNGKIECEIPRLTSESDDWVQVWILGFIEDLIMSKDSTKILMDLQADLE